jgi:hypothetical protein
MKKDWKVAIIVWCLSMFWFGLAFPPLLILPFICFLLFAVFSDKN